MRRRIRATTNKLDEKLDKLKITVHKDSSDKVHSRNSAESRRSAALEGIGSIMPEPNVAITEVPSQAPADLSEKDSGRKSVDSDSKRSSKLPTFDPAAPAVQDSDMSDDDDDEEDDDDHAFDHPSTYVNQVWIWIPKDTLGLSELLVRDLKAVGVDASDVGANMDEQGVVEVSRNPPDEDWSGGHDA